MSPNELGFSSSAGGDFFAARHGSTARPALDQAQRAGMAAKLYEVRQTARVILADRYAARMAELGQVVRNVAAQRRCGQLVAAEDIVRAADLQGFDALQVLAAAVELAEPSV